MTAWEAVPLAPFAVCGALLAGCGAGALPSSAPPSASPEPAASPFPDGPLGHYHSKRLGASLALPDGHAWRIDDHSRPELVATHPPTRSRVALAVFRADSLVGRSQCEALARAQKLVPAGDLRTLEDDVAFTQQTFDTRVWVAVEPGERSDRSLTGYVMAFGGFLRKCIAFVFATQVDRAADAPVLAARLAFARARVLGGVVLDPFAAVPREGRLPTGPSPGSP